MTAARVMVADDSEVVRAMLKSQLEAQGHFVIEAEDGVRALELVSESAPDIILLDIEMPRLDGWGVLKALRTDAGIEIPVIFLTAHSNTDHVVEGLRMGAHDFLGKPFVPSELIARVSAALRVKELQDALRARNAELDQLARTDTLTGLFNRRHLVGELTAVSARSSRRNELFGVVMIDVDHFKRVNDTEGHAAGDAVLREVASRVAATVRSEDVAGRWGGEEFIVLISPAQIETTRVLGERLREAVANNVFEVGTDKHIPITISVGFAVGPGNDPDSVIRRADTALYAAKEGGRNRVVESTDDPPA